MADHVRVMVQVKSSTSLAATSFSTYAASPFLAGALPGGVEIDSSYSPVPIPARAQGAAPMFNMSPGTGLAAPAPEGAFEPFNFGFEAAPAAPVPATYVVRGSVEAAYLPQFLEKSKDNPNIVGVFSDPVIKPVATCPSGPMGTDRDVAARLAVSKLAAKGMTGAGVKVVIVDTGVNLKYLQQRGKTPAFDSLLSWGPQRNQPLGNMPVGHGTMCAYDVCIAAPECTLVDHALLTSTASGGSVMDGFLSDAVASYGVLLGYLMKAPEPFAGDVLPRTLVINNSWGMFHPSWDFPVGSPGNYSDNPRHPFNIIVASLEAAGADILFAAGNCGPECPDSRCQGATAEGIYGANSSPAVTSVAGVVITGDRVGYSTKGPGRLDHNKPDIASYTHFAGSGVYEADGGTSAATPVLTGVVAAIRRLYPASVLSPARLRELLRQTADSRGSHDEYGAGVINVEKLVQELENLQKPAGQPQQQGKKVKIPVHQP
ncbi:MAG: S8 family serine peptidase [Chitinophagaceae bacterium]